MSNRSRLQPDPGSAPRLERAIDDYLRAPETRKTRRHLAYDEADLRTIAQRLPGMDERWADVATVDDVTDAGVRAAFSKYLVESSEQDMQRVARTWRGFLRFLTNRRLVDPTAFNGVPPPPPKRSKIKTVVAPSKGLIITLLVPFVLVLGQQFVASNREQAANERAARNDRVRTAQAEAIQGMTKAFTDLAALSAKVQNADFESPDLQRDMAAVREDILSQQSSATALVVGLLTDFNNIDFSLVTNTATVLDLYYAAVDSTAYYISLPGTTDGQREELVDALLLTGSGANNIGNGTVVILLTCLLDYADNGAAQVCGFPRSNAEGLIRTFGDELASSVNKIELHAATFKTPIFTISSPQAQRFNELDRQLSLWLAEDPSRTAEDFPQYKEMVSVFKSIDRGSRLRANSVAYPREYLLELGAYFDLEFRLPKRSPAPDCDASLPDLKVCVERPPDTTTGG